VSVRDGNQNETIRYHSELEVYKLAFEVSMRLFELSKRFPTEERFALTDQIRRSSRSVCANLAEAWRKRRYRAAFVAKLNDAEGEASETQTWIEYAVGCRYVDAVLGQELIRTYDRILGKLVTMINHPGSWLLAVQ
jgi:four helix bundle protein